MIGQMSQNVIKCQTTMAKQNKANRYYQHIHY